MWQLYYFSKNLFWICLKEQFYSILCPGTSNSGKPTDNNDYLNNIDSNSKWPEMILKKLFIANIQFCINQHMFSVTLTISITIVALWGRRLWAAPRKSMSELYEVLNGPKLGQSPEKHNYNDQYVYVLAAVTGIISTFSYL